MKKIVFSLLVLFSAICANAQIYGTFGCKDPDAWFDKEIYFVAYNGFVYYGYGQNLQNVQFRVNGKDWYTVAYWQYGTYATLEDAELEKGSTVEMYMNNQRIGYWVCSESQPSLTGKIWDEYKKKIVKGGLSGIVKILKYLK